MKKTITIQKYSDPGHGWFSLPLTALKDYGLSLESFDKLTVNSKGTRVYFEEDCEFTPIFNQLKEKGINIKIKDNHTNKQCKIRSYGIISLDMLKFHRGHFF